MKTVLAILAVVTLVWAQAMAVSQPLSVCAATVTPCCGCHRACCQAPAAPVSQPVPAVPAPSAPSNLFLNFAPASPAWVLPLSQSVGTSFHAFPGLAGAGAPLYERNCARLI